MRPIKAHERAYFTLKTAGHDLFRGSLVWIIQSLTTTKKRGRSTIAPLRHWITTTPGNGFRSHCDRVAWHKVGYSFEYLPDFDAEVTVVDFRAVEFDLIDQCQQQSRSDW